MPFIVRPRQEQKLTVELKRISQPVQGAIELPANGSFAYTFGAGKAGDRLALKEQLPDELTLFGQQTIHPAPKRIDFHSLDADFLQVRIGGQSVIILIANLTGVK